MTPTALAEAVADRYADAGNGPTTITGLQRLTGGASRETWSMTAVSDRSPDTELILRRDPPGLEEPERMALEAASIIEARRAGVPVPRLYAHSRPGTTDDTLGTAYMLMEKLPGEALPQRLLRDPEYADIRPRLAYEAGRTLARIHRMDPERVAGLADQDPIESLFPLYLSIGSRLPALDLAFRWLREHRPETTRKAVVHGDFRNGNLLVEPDGIRAVLDWELVHLGDPMEDLGWLCTKTWRFGSSAPVGGFGERDELFRGYADECGVAPDPAAVHWWEVYGTLRWAYMCRLQASRGSDSGSNPLELLAIGRRITECEHDLLNLLGVGTAERPSTPPEGPADDDLFGTPSAAALLGAVRGFVRSQSDDATGRSRYLGRVAGNVLGVVERELTTGDAARRDHRARLAALNLRSEAELAVALAEGALSIETAEVADAVRGAVAARLAVAAPNYV
ncbi:phosphotransferase family protein [Rhodococcus sp. NPDC003318]|uniref:phosphotransferase family protein n=1 Tax=Rhodococcus sp. NPDC003318 TaxID=3364503 RepID=UPI0036B3C246